MKIFGYACVSTDGQTLEALKVAGRDKMLQEKVSGARADRAQRARPMLDADTERAARAFLKRLEGKYPVIEGIVYGSRARGDHNPDSDADLAIILKGERGDRYKVAGDMAGIAFHVMMETGVMVEPLPLWSDEFEHPERFRNPRLIENIRREGLRL